MMMTHNERNEGQAPEFTPQTQLAALTAQMADLAELNGANPDDTNGIVRAVVAHYGLSFNAWLVVCCELADRKAKREGFANKVDRAFGYAKRAQFDNATPVLGSQRTSR